MAAMSYALRSTAGLRRRGSTARRPPPVWPIAWQDALVQLGPISQARVLAQATLLAPLTWVSLGYLLDGLRRSQRASSWLQGLLENADLIFHEAGHWIFGVLGIDLLTVAGGSLMQLLVPALCVWAFLTRHPDPFAATFAAWWAGQSLTSLAPYIADARAQRLVLLGGVTGGDRPGYHDWNNLLGRLGLLPLDAALGWLAHLGGLLLMFGALLLALQVIRQQWRG